MEKFYLVDLVFVIRGGECGGIGFGFNGFLAVILGGEVALCTESADVGSDAVAKRFASFTLDGVAIIEGLSGATIISSLSSISIAVESVDFWIDGDGGMGCAKVLVCLECADEVIVSIFRGYVIAMVSV